MGSISCEFQSIQVLTIPHEKSWTIVYMRRLHERYSHARAKTALSLC